jgi:hypothetical protein
MINFEKTTNQLKGNYHKELILSLGKEEYRQRYIGDYKNHIKKIKGIFHNHKTGITNHDQAYPNMMSFAKPKSKIHQISGEDPLK